MNDYWDIDQVLSQEEEVRVKTRLEIRKPGKNELIPVSSKIRVPLWLGLAMSTRDIADIEAPYYLSEDYCGSILASSTALNLRQHSLYFFEICRQMTEVLSFRYYVPLVPAFLNRARFILESIESNEGPNLTRRLTTTEQSIFQDCRKAVKEFMHWKERKCEKIVIERATKRIKTSYH